MTHPSATRSAALVISCTCLAAILSSAPPVARAGDSPQVADLRFTVSDPLDTSLLDNPALEFGIWNSQNHYLNENGLVVVQAQGATTYVWDSQTGSVQKLYATFDFTAASCLNRQGTVVGYTEAGWYGDIAVRWDRQPDGSYLLGTELPGLNNDDNYVAATVISDTDWIYGHWDNGLTLGIRWAPDGTVHSNIDPALWSASIDNSGAVSGMQNLVAMLWEADGWLIIVPIPPGLSGTQVTDSNGSGIMVGLAAENVGWTGYVIRWKNDYSWELLPFDSPDDAAYYSPVIADNGIIGAEVAAARWGGYYSLWLWDPVSLEPFALDDLIDPNGNPEGLEFHWNNPIYGMASNAAYTRLYVSGYIPVPNVWRYVVLTAITRGLTKEADFEAGHLAAFDLAGSGSATIIDDPYDPSNNNHVLQLDGNSSVSQQVSMLENAHDLVFKAHANQDAGVLTVKIDGKKVARFPGKDLRNPSMIRQSVRLTDLDLLGKDGVDLEFSWNGASGEQILIDDISFGKGAHASPPTPDSH